LVHRDIKPSNLMLANAGYRMADSPNHSSSAIRPPSKQSAIGNPPAAVIKILDLGLARLQHPAQGSRTAHLTVLGGASVMQGTPDYMAPEQALDFHSADLRADIYSLGCTFHFLLTGQPPFPGGNLAEKLMKHQTAEPRPIETLRKEVPAVVGEVLHKMLAKRPVERYAACGEVGAILSSLLLGRPEGRLPELGGSTVWNQRVPGPKGGSPRTSQPDPRKRRRWAAIIASVLGCVGLISILALFRSDGVATTDREGSSLARGGADATNRSKTVPVDPALVGHWRLDEGAGTSAAAASGKSNSGIMRQGAAWSSDRSDAAVTFDGRAGFIDYGTGSAFNFAEKAGFTFAVWVKTRANYGAIISQRSTTNDKPVI
jgi:serine/threonine protein kinase